MTLTEALLRQIINGLVLGSFYALIALGYSMVYGIIRMINFAHGDVYMVGSFLFLFFASLLGKTHPLLCASLAAVCCGILGGVIYRIAYRPLLDTSRMSLLITAIGVSLILSNGMMFLSHGQFLFFDAGITHTGRLQLLLLIAASILMLILTYVVRRTRLGAAMRAVSMDPDAAALMGIPVGSTVACTFFLGSALAAAAGSMACVYYGSLHYSMGYLMGIKAFSAAVIGGIGSLPGALLGGILLGLLESLGTQLLGSAWKDVFAFLLLILVLLIRPSGLLGREERMRM